jgi:hypothetical protein
LLLVLLLLSLRLSLPHLATATTTSSATTTTTNSTTTSSTCAEARTSGLRGHVDIHVAVDGVRGARLPTAARHDAVGSSRRLVAVVVVVQPAHGDLPPSLRGIEAEALQHVVVDVGTGLLLLPPR